MILDLSLPWRVLLLKERREGSKKEPVSKETSSFHGRSAEI